MAAVPGSRPTFWSRPSRLRGRTAAAPATPSPADAQRREERTKTGDACSGSSCRSSCPAISSRSSARQAPRAGRVDPRRDRAFLRPRLRPPPALQGDLGHRHRRDGRRARQRKRPRAPTDEPASGTRATKRDKDPPPRTQFGSLRRRGIGRAGFSDECRDEPGRESAMHRRDHVGTAAFSGIRTRRSALPCKPA